MTVSINDLTNEVKQYARSLGADLVGIARVYRYSDAPRIPLNDLSTDSYKTLGRLGGNIPDLRSNAPFTAAAGLGEIGLSGLLLTPELGSKQRYVFVLTDALLPETTFDQGLRLCGGGCIFCVEACPVQAPDPRQRRMVVTSQGNKCKVMARQEKRCAWARTLGLVVCEGSDQLGWRLPHFAGTRSFDPGYHPIHIKPKGSDPENLL
jgi:hypothetical protein